jgi:hypothetical protein
MRLSLFENIIRGWYNRVVAASVTMYLVAFHLKKGKKNINARNKIFLVIKTMIRIHNIECNSKLLLCQKVRHQNKNFLPLRSHEENGFGK